MARGRKRLFNPTIPAHIDQEALPPGVYWEDNRWYVREVNSETGSVHKKTIAWATATLPELQGIVDAKTACDAPMRGTVASVSAHFQTSTEFSELAVRTQKDYRRISAEACSYVLRDGSSLGEQSVDRMTVSSIQRLVEILAGGREATLHQPKLPATPTKANQVHRYLRRLFAWGIRHGHCTQNPAKGVRQAKEAKRNRMPKWDVFEQVLAFARERGKIPAHRVGSVSPYLHAVMILAYNVRLRGIEVCTISDDQIRDEGIVSNRRKHSRDNITCWNAELRQAVKWLREYRQQCWEKSKIPIPVNAQERFLIVNESGYPLTKSALDTAWQRMIRSAIVSQVIAKEERFSLHGLKHLGITHSDDKRSGGHRTEAMRQHYDHELPIFNPPRRHR